MSGVCTRLRVDLSNRVIKKRERERQKARRETVSGDQQYAVDCGHWRGKDKRKKRITYIKNRKLYDGNEKVGCGWRERPTYELRRREFTTFETAQVAKRTRGSRSDCTAFNEEKKRSSASANSCKSWEREMRACVSWSTMV